MSITKEIIAGLLERYGEYLYAGTIERLAADLDRAIAAEKAVAGVKAEEEAMHSRHQQERGEMMERLGRARKGCPHPAWVTTYGTGAVGRNSPAQVCAACGIWEAVVPGKTGEAHP